MKYKAKRIKVSKALAIYRRISYNDPSLAICGSLAMFLYKLNKKTTVGDIDLILPYKYKYDRVRLKDFSWEPHNRKAKNNSGKPFGSIKGMGYHKEVYWMGSRIRAEVFFVKPYKTIYIEYKGHKYRVQAIQYILNANLAWSNDEQVYKKVKYKNNLSNFDCDDDLPF